MSYTTSNGSADWELRGPAVKDPVTVYKDRGRWEIRVFSPGPISTYEGRKVSQHKTLKAAKLKAEKLFCWRK